MGLVQAHKRLQVASALLVGLLFGVGLTLSGMTRPSKVIGFLDVFGGWDPSLIIVMCSALPIHYLAYRWIRGRKSPLLDSVWHYPKSREINWKLIVGSALFGAGWGLGGFCPGPAITAAASQDNTVFVFLIAMTLGMLGYQIMDKVIQVLRAKAHKTVNT